VAAASSGRAAQSGTLSSRGVQENRSASQADRQQSREDLQQDRQQSREDLQQDRQDTISDYDDYGDGHYEDNLRAASVAAGVVLGAALTADQFYGISANCGTVTMDGLTYYQCGDYWYQSSYLDGEETYVIADPF